MKVKLLTSRVLASGQTQDWGDVVELDNREGAKLVSLGQALALETNDGGGKPAPSTPKGKR